MSSTLPACSTAWSAARWSASPAELGVDDADGVTAAELAGVVTAAELAGVVTAADGVVTAADGVVTAAVGVVTAAVGVLTATDGVDTGGGVSTVAGTVAVGDATVGGVYAGVSTVAGAWVTTVSERSRRRRRDRVGDRVGKCRHDSPGHRRQRDCGYRRPGRPRRHATGKYEVVQSSRL